MDAILDALQRPGHGGVVLFLGAGFSREAINRNKKTIPTAKEFAKFLAAEIDQEPDVPLTIVSELYQDTKPDKLALLKLIKSTFTVENITAAQEAILRYPWKRIYTTNYDDVAEHVKAPDGTIPSSYSRHNTPLEFEDGRRQIIHLNGLVSEIKHGSEVDDLALTLASYIDASFYSSPWATVFRQDLILASCVIFVGYSMYDTDVSYIVGKNPAIKDKTFLIQHEALSQPDKLFLSRFGHVLPVGLDNFATAINSVLDAGVSTRSLKGPENFEEILLPKSPAHRSVTDGDIEALLVRGIYDRELYWSSKLTDGRSYVTPRAAAAEALRSLRDEGAICVLHSHLGNGKSFVVEQVIFSLLQDGFRVFTLKRNSDNFATDIEFFGDVKRYVIIVEEMVDNDDVIGILTSQLGRCRLLVTVRTSALEVKVDDVFNLVRVKPIELDVNKLHPSDIDSLVPYLNSGAYWSHVDNVGNLDSKRKYISKRCNAEMQSVSLGIIRSLAQNEKIKDFFRRPLGLAHDSIVLAMMLSYFEMYPSFEFMSELLGKDIFSLREGMKDAFIADFFAVEGNSIGARSPILAQYILQNFVSDDALLSISAKALRNSSDRHTRAERYRTFNSKIMQFSNISRILSNTPNKNLKIREYYDNVGEIGYKDFSPYYWLQYAIASSADRDYLAADRYYRESMKILERRSDFYRYKIENSFAMFLLDSRSETDLWDDYVQAFLDASRLSKVHTAIRETGTHPYKVVEKFYEYLQRRASFIKRADRERILEDLDAWLVRLDSLPKLGGAAAKRIPKARESILDSRALMLRLKT